MPIDAKSLEILRDAAATRKPVFFSGDGLDVTFQTYILSVTDDEIWLENRVPPEHISKFIHSKNFALLVSMVRFQAKRLDNDGQNLRFPLTKDSLIEETRGSERYSFSSDEHVICEFLNPFDHETRLSKTVIDMSATGLSIRTTLESQLFRPGNVLPELQVLIDGEPYTRGRGRIVYTRKLMDLRGGLRLQVGIKFEAVGENG